MFGASCLMIRFRQRFKGDFPSSGREGGRSARETSVCCEAGGAVKFSSFLSGPPKRWRCPEKALTTLGFGYVESAATA